MQVFHVRAQLPKMDKHHYNALYGFYAAAKQAAYQSCHSQGSAHEVIITIQSEAPIKFVVENYHNDKAIPIPQVLGISKTYRLEEDKWVIDVSAG